MNEVFSLRRLALLLRADAINGYRKLLVVSLAIAAVMMICTLLPQWFSGDFPVLSSRWWFAALLFTWGLVLSSKAFAELHDKTRNEIFLLLPASALEKTFARLLLATVAFVPYLLLFTVLVSLLTDAVSALIFDRRAPLLELPGPSIWPLTGYYVVAQSVFFLGGAWFRKNHLAKTLLALIGGLIALVGIGALIVRIVLGPVYSTSVSGDLTGLWEVISTALKIALFVLPVFCWTVAWLRVRETQASHGI